MIARERKGQGQVACLSPSHRVSFFFQPLRLPLHTDCRAWAVGSLTLLFLQSVTWSSGLMFLSAPSLLLAYLFSSLNTAQALLITILHCTLARKVRHVTPGKDWT